MQPKEIAIYTDGSCIDNPGPSGAGAVLVYGRHRKLVTQPLGDGTNNTAELLAVFHALNEIKPAHRQQSVVTVHSDSTYCIGVLSGSKNAKVNRELIQQVRKLVDEFSVVQFVKVQGHSGNPKDLNAMAHQLALKAAYSN